MHDPQTSDTLFDLHSYTWDTDLLGHLIRQIVKCEFYLLSFPN